MLSLFGSHRERAAQWARDLLAGSFVIVDTETTGLDGVAEVVQIGVIDQDGAVLLDTLVRPTRPIPEGATRIHGITNAMVAAAPTFAEILPQLQGVLRDRTVVIFNAAYDRRMFDQSAMRNGIGVLALDCGATYHCAMKQYSDFVGERTSKGSGYKRQSLPNGDHSAIGDCRATLALIQQMAADESE